jgi:Transposase DNA-binding
MEPIDPKLNFAGHLGDKRLEKRAASVQRSLLQGRSSSIHGITHSESDQKGFYRFIKNDKVTEAKIIQCMQLRAGELSGGREVLVIQDSSDIDLSKHRNRLSDQESIGPIGDHNGVGFILHSSLVLDANSLTPLGFSAVQLLHRSHSYQPFNQRHAAINHKPIEEKESYRWIKSSEQTQQYLCGALHITIIEDREGDIYEQFARIPDERTDLIVRSKTNRIINDREKLFEQLSAQPLSGVCEVEIEADKRKKRVKRIASLEVRFCSVRIKKPKGLKTARKEIILQAIEVKEPAYQEREKIHWRLLTTQQVENFEDALLVIRRYEQRWFIEQVYRLLKKKGFRIEDSELEAGSSIRKLTLLQLVNVLRVMQLLLAYDNEEGQPLNEVFSREEIKCLEKLNSRYQTNKIINPYKKQTLTWASWIIARIGGWKNAKKERPPGPIILKNGLEKFNNIFEGWILAQKDVS